MRSCARHPWRYSMCPDCDAVNPPLCDCQKCRPAPLTGIERAALEPIRARFDKTQDTADPYDVAAETDANGNVHVRHATVADDLDRIIAHWLWEEAHRAFGDVDAA